MAFKEFGFSNFSEAMRDHMRKTVERYNKIIEERGGKPDGKRNV